MKNILLALLLCHCISNAFATTWNEPWMDAVIKEADFFVLAEVLSYDEAKGVKLKITKQLGGKELPKTLEIKGFYLLNLTSVSHPVEFEFKGIKQGYFFIKKKNGKYCIATPTTGFAAVIEGEVYATYRHSYHQALVSANVYETTMTAIYNHYHQLPYEKEPISKFIEQYLSEAPSVGDSPEESKLFFLQHVALECIFHLRLEGYYDKILPFFNNEKNFHHRVSAARALIVYNTETCQNLLLNKIENNKDDHFATVICIWTLKAFKPSNLKSSLEKILPKASDEYHGFGGNIMDPRVGTSFPSVKSALKDLIDSL